MKEYKAYIFDMDLTLLNSIESSISSYIKAFEAVGKVFDKKTITHQLSLPLRGTYAEIDNPQDSPEKFIKAFSDDSKINFNKLSFYYDDVLPFFEKLKSNNKVIGIVTNRERINVSSNLEVNPNIGRHVDEFVTCDMVKNMKPSGEPLLKCIEMLGVKSEETLYVGDARNDYLCALNAGVDFVCIERHNNCNFQCPIIVHSLNEIF